MCTKSKGFIPLVWGFMPNPIPGNCCL